MMTDEARKRIQALEMFSDLGSGFQIAMKDLEIRGAGDLLGGEQSGFINEIGFETYQKILNEALDELKENEFKTLYNEHDILDKSFVKEVQIDSDFEILFPDDYINVITERLNLYRELNDLKDDNALVAFENNLVDRFGKLPKPVVNLLDSVRLKWLAKKLGMERVILKKQRLLGYFIADHNSGFYQSQTFAKVIEYIKNHPQSGVLKEKETKEGLRLLMTLIKIDSVQKALQVLQDFLR